MNILIKTEKIEKAKISNKKLEKISILRLEIAW